MMIKRITLPILISCLLFSAGAFAAPPERIVSLAPNVTEILYGLGLESRIVAVTQYCDYPPAAREKPKVGGFTNPSLEAIVAAKPDLVVLTEDGNPKAIYVRLRGLGIPCYVFKARRLAELPQGIRDLGQILGVKARADGQAQQLERDMERLHRTAQNRRSGPVLSALFIIQPEPALVAGPGTLIDEAMRLLGVRNGAADGPGRYPKYSLEEIVRQSPDFFLIVRDAMSGGGYERLFERLHMLPAVQDRRICTVSSRLYRLSPRALEGVEEIARCAERQKP